MGCLAAPLIVETQSGLDCPVVVFRSAATAMDRPRGVAFNAQGTNREKCGNRFAKAS